MKTYLDRNLVALDDLRIDAQAMQSLARAAPLLLSKPELQPAAEVIQRVLAAKRNALHAGPWAVPAGFAPEPEPELKPVRERVTISPSHSVGRWLVERAGGIEPVISANGAVELLAALLASHRGIPGTHRDAERVRRLLMQKQVRLEGESVVWCMGGQLHIQVNKDIELVVELPDPEPEAADQVSAEPQRESALEMSVRPQGDLQLEAPAATA